MSNGGRNLKRALLQTDLMKVVIEVGIPAAILPDMLKVMAGMCVTDLTSKNPKLSPIDSFETFRKKMRYGTTPSKYEELDTRFRKRGWYIDDIDGDDDVITKTMHLLYQITAKRLQPSTP